MKKMKKFLLTALAALVTFSSCGGALADTELPYTTYNYDYWGYIVYTPAAYVPAGSITGASFQYNGQSLGAFKNPQDLCVAQDGTVYLADSGNNRIVLLSSDMTKVVRVITGFENHGVADTFQTPTGVIIDVLHRGFLLWFHNHYLHGRSPLRDHKPPRGCAESG